MWTKKKGKGKGSIEGAVGVREESTIRTGVALFMMAAVRWGWGLVQRAARARQAECVAECMAEERVSGGRVGVRAVKGGARPRRSRGVARRTFIDGVHVANTRAQDARRPGFLFCFAETR